MAHGLYVNDAGVGEQGGTWKEILTGHVNVAGTWKNLLGGWVNVSGVWKLIYPPQQAIPSGMRVFDLENDYEDQNGLDDWDAKTNVQFTSGTVKYGTYALEKSATNSHLDLYGWDHNESQFASAWVYFSDIVWGTPEILSVLGCFELISGVTNSIRIRQNEDDLIFEITKGDTTEQETLSSVLTVGWHYLAVKYDSVADLARFWFDNTIIEITPSGTWASGVASSRNMIFYMEHDGKEDTRIIDEIALIEDACPTDVEINRYYYSSLPWYQG